MKSKPFLIIFDGPMGSGKSTITKLIRSKLSKTAIIDWDALKEMISNYEQASKDKDKLLNIRILLTKAYIENGFNVLLDGGFSSGDKVLPFIKLAKQKKLKVLIYQFTAAHKILLQRALARPKFAWEKKKIGKVQIAYNLDYYEDHKFTGEIKRLFDSDKTASQQMLKAILQDIQ